MTRTNLPHTIKPMLGRLARNAFDSQDHLFELKWDGMRALAFIESETLKISSRNGRDITSNFPELAEFFNRETDVVGDSESDGVD